MERAREARELQNCRSIQGMQSVASTATLVGHRPLTRDGLSEIDYITRQLPLPETAHELCNVARSIGIPESEIRLAARATEGAVSD
jgi:hypothetical protein